MVSSDAFPDVGRLPAPGDNGAIASRFLPPAPVYGQGNTDFQASRGLLGIAL